MAIEPQFSRYSETAHIQYVSNIDDMIERARRSSKNDYMFDSMHGYGPLEFMDLDLKEESEFFFVQQPDGEIIAAAIMKPHSDREDVINLDGITVHKDFQRLGLATQLLWHVMNHADEQGKKLKIHTFLREGYEFTKSTLPHMHHNEFPDLRIQIEDNPGFQDGHRSYEMPHIECLDEAPV